MVSKEDILSIKGIRRVLMDGRGEVLVENLKRDYSFSVKVELNERERSILLKGGLLAWIKSRII